MDALLRTYVTLYTFTTDRLETMRRDERGQGTIEYVGMVIVAALIVLAVIETDMGKTIGEKFKGKINEVLDAG